MHNVCIALTDKDDRTNEEVRASVYNYLMDDGFCEEPKRFMDTVADYAVIGGRYNDFFNADAELIDLNGSDLGDENSAVIVTEEIWEKDLKNLLNSDTPIDLRNKTCIFDIEYDDITKENVVNKKWAVIVDFHF